jgi:hypothetical protein
VFQNARQPRPPTRITTKFFSTAESSQKRILHDILSLLTIGQPPESVIEKVIAMPANAIGMIETFFAAVDVEVLHAAPLLRTTPFALSTAVAEPKSNATVTFRRLNK